MEAAKSGMELGARDYWRDETLGYLQFSWAVKKSDTLIKFTSLQENRRTNIFTKNYKASYSFFLYHNTIH